MTFAPEWLAGSPNLDTSNWIFMWVYLFFLNFLWVVVPLWVLYESYSAFVGAVEGKGKTTVTIEQTSKANGKEKKSK